MRWVGAVVTPFILGACYGAPPCEPHDDDGDGFDDCFDDCDPSDPEINPDAEEVCDDEIDNDCDGISAMTGGVEICGNEQDDDCDGEIDEAPDQPGIELNCNDELDDDCDGLADTDDPDCADLGSVGISYSFMDVADCAAAGVETLTLTANNGTGTLVTEHACNDFEVFFWSSAGVYTLEVTGTVPGEGRTWNSGPVEVTLTSEQTVMETVTLTCTGCQ